MYLLLAIGLKGGVQLATTQLWVLAGPAFGTLLLGLVIPVVAYWFLRRAGRLNRADAAAIAAHYGSVSAVTYAVVLVFLERNGVTYEHFTAVLLVLLEIPTIEVGGLPARWRGAGHSMAASKLLREVFLGKSSIYLLLVGLCAGVILGPAGMLRSKWSSWIRSRGLSPSSCWRWAW